MQFNDTIKHVPYRWCDMQFNDTIKHVPYRWYDIKLVEMAPNKI
jgi:hypothetical protein